MKGTGGSQPRNTVLWWCLPTYIYHSDRCRLINRVSFHSKFATNLRRQSMSLHQETFLSFLSSLSKGPPHTYLVTVDRYINLFSHTCTVPQGMNHNLGGWRETVSSRGWSLCLYTTLKSSGDISTVFDSVLVFLVGPSSSVQVSRNVGSVPSVRKRTKEVMFQLCPNVCWIGHPVPVKVPSKYRIHWHAVFILLRRSLELTNASSRICGFLHCW